MKHCCLNYLAASQVFLALDAIWDIFFVVEWIVLILAAPDIWFLLTFEAVAVFVIFIIFLFIFGLW